MRRLCAFSMVFAAMCAAARGEERPEASFSTKGVRVVAHANPTRVTVGDRILYSLGVVVPEGVAVAFPPVGRSLGDFHVRDLGRGSSKGSRKGWKEITRTYEMRIYRTGDHFIPSLSVSLTNDSGAASAVETGGISVRVESVLEAGAKDIKDIKPPLALAYRPPRLLLWLALAGAAAIVAVVWVRRRRAVRGVPETPPLPPHLVAYEELERILSMKLVAAGRLKEYYTRISNVVRRYIEARFKLRAPEMTTEEFLEAARRRLDVRSRALVGDFLESCDMVKFACYGPSREECEMAYRAAKKFIDETKEVEDNLPSRVS